MSQFTVEDRVTSEYLIKRSRFVASLSPCPDLSALSALLERLAGEHPQATHITYAFRILTPEGLRERGYDAGEPSGTAGRPILKHLQGKQVINACLAVVRYFGGIKLGAGGLARAYGQAAQQVLESAKLKPHIVYQTLEVNVDYAGFHLLNQRLTALEASLVTVEYGPRVKATVRLPEAKVEAAKQLLKAYRCDLSLGP
ncbi:IMPACT family protein [Methylothermus subterraneus]